jgi:uncharacterized membrane protein YraQ (UPF0718 family)
MKPKTQKKLIQPAKNILTNLPIMFSVILALGLFKNFVTFETLAGYFTGNPVIDTMIGSLSGSIMAGNSINSYIIGTEMISSGISTYAIIAFLAAWVTVGFIQIPVEISYFGKSFTFIRNVLSILLSMVTALIVAFLLGVIA